MNNDMTPHHPMKYDAFLQEIRDLIARDRLDEALPLLRSLLDNSPQLDEVIHQSGRFAAIRNQIRLGVVSHEEANLTRNQISHAMLELLSEIEAQELEKPALKQEMEGAIANLNSENVISDATITAAGDVHIGDKQATQQAEKIYNIGEIDNADFS